MNFFRKKDSELGAASTDFYDQILADYAALNLALAQATAYGVLNTAFVNAYGIAIDPETRTQQAIAAKDEARKALVLSAKGIAEFLFANPNVSNSTLIGLGLNPRRERVPAPPPTATPGVEVLLVKNNLIKASLKPIGGDRPRAKPVGTSGISVWTHVGETAPLDPSEWIFQGNTGRTTMEIQMDNSLAPGTKVWITAFYFNNKKQSGPSAQPVYTHLQGSYVQLQQAA